MRRWDLDDLAGVGDLAREWGVSVSGATTWTRRYSDFPAPLVNLSAGPVYSRRQVRSWREARWGDSARIHRGPQDVTRHRAPYGDVIADLRSRVRSGEWQPGERIPSRVALAEHYGVSAGKASRIIGELVAEGLLTSMRSSGTYITKRKEQP